MITCANCNTKFDSMAEMGDHLGETSHEDYRTTDGIALPWEIGVLLMAGAKWCSFDLGNYNLCREQFTNNYRFYEHVIRKEHFDLLKDYFIREKKRLDDFEREWFFNREHIRYQRPPLPISMKHGRIEQPDGNLIVKCPTCGKLYESGFFMDANPQDWKPDSRYWMMTCSKCGKTTNTSNQNIRLRQEVYGILIASQRREITNLRQINKQLGQELE